MLIRGLAEPDEKIPGRKAIASACEVLAEEKKAEDRAKIAALPKHKRICCTADGWSSAGKHSYCVVTAHWLDAAYKLQSAIAGCAQFKGKHDAANVRTTIYKSLADNMSIGKERVDVMTTDNGCAAAPANVIRIPAPIVEATHPRCPEQDHSWT